MRLLASIVRLGAMLSDLVESRWHAAAAAVRVEVRRAVAAVALGNRGSRGGHIRPGIRGCGHTDCRLEYSPGSGSGIDCRRLSVTGPGSSLGCAPLHPMNA